MKGRLLVFIGLILAATAALGAQSGPAANPPTPPEQGGPLTLVGCVQPDTARPEQFTLSDKTGTTYHLSGANVKAYVWRNVRIVGGLVPSPNVAAQVGAIDQTRAAMAYQAVRPSGAGNGDPVHFHVTRVRRLTGSCAPKSDR